MTPEEKKRLLDAIPFRAPTGYRWLIDRGLAGFEANSALQPWYLLPAEEVFSATERWPRDGTAELFAFARRQDCDDLACFVVEKDSLDYRVALIHGWTPEGYEVVHTFSSFWEWLKSVIGDIEEWVTLSARES